MCSSVRMLVIGESVNPHPQHSVRCLAFWTVVRNNVCTHSLGNLCTHAPSTQKAKAPLAAGCPVPAGVLPRTGLPQPALFGTPGISDASSVSFLSPRTDLHDPFRFHIFTPCVGCRLSPEAAPTAGGTARCLPPSTLRTNGVW